MDQGVSLFLIHQDLPETGPTTSAVIDQTPSATGEEFLQKRKRIEDQSQTENLQEEKTKFQTPYETLKGNKAKDQPAYEITKDQLPDGTQKEKGMKDQPQDEFLMRNMINNQPANLTLKRNETRDEHPEETLKTKTRRQTPEFVVKDLKTMSFSVSKINSQSGRFLRNSLVLTLLNEDSVSTYSSKRSVMCKTKNLNHLMAARL